MLKVSSYDSIHVLNTLVTMIIQNITVYDKKEFRKWLKKYHKKESKIGVVVHKRHTGKPAPSHRELMDEAISFGWIDTTLKRLDDHTYIRYFSKRTNNSRWSDNTISYAKLLIKEGMMSEQGMYYYKLGLAKPTHDYGIPKNPEIPPELALALSKNKKAKQNFDKFSPSVKKTFYRWLLRAKMPATKQKRVKIIVEKAYNMDKSIL